MEKKRISIKYKNLTRLRMIYIFGFLIDEYLLLQVSKNIISDYIIKKFLYFTSWSHMVTSLYFILSIIFQNDKKKTKKLSILFHLSISCQFMVTFVYWTMLAEGDFRRIKDPYLRKYNVTAHIFPFIYLFIDFFLNNIVLESKKTFYSIFGFTTLYLFFLSFLELNYELNLYEDINFRNLYTFFFGLGSYFMVFSGWLLFKNLEKLKYKKEIEDKKNK